MITIVRKLPVINGFVQVPDAKPERQVVVESSDVESAIADSTKVNVVRQCFVELPAFNALTNTGYPEDWFETIRGI
jgi:hypothetical protein